VYSIVLIEAQDAGDWIRFVGIYVDNSIL
jgi:hypothetical protein